MTFIIYSEAFGAIDVHCVVSDRLFHESVVCDNLGQVAEEIDNFILTTELDNLILCDNQSIPFTYNH
ncbi:unnamed protein product [Rotaria magnacalcarata]|uniref:Uncharacterized protein n=1 Tax=Rotaria magnacalcarata TaxID=392030 RepID=A0A819ETB4_9BILA|nr:unnamed protein product [Rotaria magnacalcarata]CAF3932636.1 unnamed protein product [Rotaria magnacalcarata]CAF4341719.1 unnamed protein product [Rotaria magnacalcarata]